METPRRHLFPVHASEERRPGESPEAGVDATSDPDAAGSATSDVEATQTNHAEAGHDRPDVAVRQTGGGRWWGLDATIGALAVTTRLASTVVATPPVRAAAQLTQRLVAPLTAEGQRVRSMISEQAGPTASETIQRFTPGVLDAVDLDSVLAAIDVDALLARIDVDDLLDRVGVDRLLQRVDVSGLVGRVDVGSILDRVDLNTLLDRVDLNA
ncbi:MAG: hypothetical protein ACKOYM_09155, partial [Actinomycetes bacterium]